MIPYLEEDDNPFEQHMTKEIVTLKAEVRQLSNNVIKLTTIIQQQSVHSVESIELPEDVALPLASSADLEELCEKLDTDSGLRVLLTKKLANIGGKDAMDCTRRILASMFTDTLATQFNWKGKGCKKIFKDLNLSGIVCAAAVRSLRETTKADVEKAMKAWLHFAPNRLKVKQINGVSCWDNFTNNKDIRRLITLSSVLITTIRCLDCCRWCERCDCVFGVASVLE
ncbi:hypothetical protein CAPTEDRAFT_227434 [Capitella teleta]|uniref:DUF4806 domain-containing protein n=1 Tax=Capitella teleta TaxID=283909 RepID=R7U3H0_CAPTE|nr:hypothetical protein CAPTEDRAFT_227434 [Capitella teleta]|eukprot:ELU00509.1 hypothetical protein CAPTEDRAFT_227434 [Capitella teleta]